ncbi:(2Fe-2S)-binding protein [Geodermatophilus sp. TF02-6]|uniref:QcrA and Rieske domain-containing protein n=1 Tax=Geodermatophilus sp. TF02-6 TaxID=2250575 RepID=UPI000DEBC976|nr:Rieske (2Fe-2S) protein [Geodermatophilus sp. TF02-6]RBY82373.1 (2Fe-2S)-binding protein [Geodermatophilus sp. TF02-6]
MKRRSAEAWVSACFLGAAAAAVGFVVAYVVDAGPQVLGGLLGTACAALAVGLVLWAAQLLPSGTYVEERRPMQPPEATQTAFVETLHRGSSGTPRLLRRTLLLAGLALGAAVVVPLRSLLLPTSAPPARALRQTPWRRGVRLMTREGDLVRADDVPQGTDLTVFPEGMPRADDATAIVVRVDPRELQQPAEGTVAGILAFSKLCTHAGCPVGLYEQTTRQLFCPCHQSVFDVLSGAEAVAGPAARALPRLPLAVDGDGYLVADGDFDGQVGPTFWRPE